MKKTIAILLVAILAVGSAFAAFSGSAQVGVGANFDTGDYGFIGNETKVALDVELATMNAEDVSEGDIYASIKGSLALRGVGFDMDGIAPGSPAKTMFGLSAEIDEAKIAGSNWYVSLKGVADVNDFAKSAIDTWTAENDKDDDWGFYKADYDKNATWKVGYDKAPGVEVGVADFVVGVGFKAKAVQEPKFDMFSQKALTLFAKTPEFAVIDGLTIQAGASYALQDAGYIDAKDKEVNALGASVKVAYASDTLSASVATDFGYDFVAEKFGADVAANVGVGFVTVDAYYATEAANDGVAGDPDKGTDYADAAKVENLLSAQVKVDLNSFDVPVKLTVSGKDIVNGVDLDASVEVKIADALTLTPSVGYDMKGDYDKTSDDKFNAGIKVGYTHEYFTVAAETSIETGFEDNDLILKASASVENSTLIPGATIKLAWSDAKDLLKNDTTKENEYGKIMASIKLDF